MISPAQIVAAFLREGSLAPFGSPSDSDPTWPVYVGSLPDGNSAPDDAACVYDTTGENTGRLLKTGNPLVRYGVQIRIRCRSYPTGWAKVYEVMEYLTLAHQEVVTVGGESYEMETFVLEGTPLAMGSEPTNKRRESFTLNGTVAIGSLD